MLDEVFLDTQSNGHILLLLRKFADPRVLEQVDYRGPFIDVAHKTLENEVLRVIADRVPADVLEQLVIRKIANVFLDSL